MKLKTLLFLLIIPLVSYSNEKRLALVIGNANYDKGPLENPVNDARLIANTLDSLNFDVILKENISTKTEFIRSIREFGMKRPEYDVAFVYYAGHGIQIENENFLLPINEEFTSEYDVLDFGVSVQNIMRYLESQTDEVNILILDACRDNPYESTWNTTRSLKGSGLAKIPAPTGSLIAFSTDAGQTAPDGDGENSIYTLSLAKNMLIEDISIDQVFRNVRSEVLTETDGMQRPVEATQLTGQSFYLLPNDYKDELNQIDRILAENKNIEKALELSNIILSNDPNNYKALQKKAHTYKIMGDIDKSKELYNSLILRDSTDILNYFSYVLHNNGGRSDLGLMNNQVDEKDDLEFVINLYKRNVYNNPWIIFQAIRKLARNRDVNNILYDELIRSASLVDKEIALSTSNDFFIYNSIKPHTEFFKNSIFYYEVYKYYMNEELEDVFRAFENYYSKIENKNSPQIDDIIYWVTDPYIKLEKYSEVENLLKDRLNYNHSVAQLNSRLSLYKLYLAWKNSDEGYKYLNEGLDYISNNSLSLYEFNTFYNQYNGYKIRHDFIFENDFIKALQENENFKESLENQKNWSQTTFFLIDAYYLSYLLNSILDREEQANISLKKFKELVVSTPDFTLYEEKYNDFSLFNYSTSSDNMNSYFLEYNFHMKILLNNDLEKSLKNYVETNKVSNSSLRILLSKMNSFLNN